MDYLRFTQAQNSIEFHIIFDAVYFILIFTYFVESSTRQFPEYQLA